MMRNTIILAALAIAACGPAPDDAGNVGATANVAAPAPDPAPDMGQATPPVADDRVSTPTPAPTIEAGDTAVPDAYSRDFADGYVVSTNEPFWQATVGRDRIVFTGAGLPDRTLAIDRRWVDGDGRHWRARDRRGAMTVSVRNQPCTDDMSARAFPFSGRIAFGSGSADGCARPAASPPPREDEPDAAPKREAAIPPPFRGTWSRTKRGCAEPASTIENVTIAARELRWHESLAVPTRVDRIGPDRIRVSADYDGEGMQWTATRTLTLQDSGGRLAIDEQPVRIRCD